MKLPKKSLLFVADPPAALSPKGDSSLALAEAALAKGYTVFWATPNEISLDNHNIVVSPANRLEQISARVPIWQKREVQTHGNDTTGVALREFSAVFIRKDPPFDHNYTTFCWLLSLEQNARYFNPPHSLLRFHEKVVQFAALSAGALHEKEVIPACISRDFEKVRRSLRHWDADKAGAGSHGYIIKPWLGYGGRGVHFARNSAEAFEIWAAETQNSLQIVQPFDPEVLQSGDVRVILARHEIIGCFARHPASGQVASNLAQGGTARAHELSEQQRDMLRRVASFLAAQQIYFSGLDLIGNRINEINITSPTGLRSIETLGKSAKEMQASQEAFRVLMEIGN